MNPWRFAGLPFVLVLLCGCERALVREPPPYSQDRTMPGDVEPVQEPLSKYGNPESYVVRGQRYYTLKTSRGFRQQGIASWYGKKFHGRRTSSGETYDMYQLTAAHKQLPLPTSVEVKNLDNGRTVRVRVNDRGPFHENRVIDLSYAAALKLGMVENGTAFVEIRALGAGARPATTTADAPAGTPPASDVYIQVGAFQDRNNARRLHERLSRVAPGKVQVREIMTAGGRLYRVQIGPIVSVPFADSLVSTLQGLGISEHHFTTN